MLEKKERDGEKKGEKKDRKGNIISVIKYRERDIREKSKGESSVKEERKRERLRVSGSITREFS